MSVKINGSKFETGEIITLERISNNSSDWGGTVAVASNLNNYNNWSLSRFIVWIIRLLFGGSF